MAQRAVMEGVAASRYTIKVDTINARVLIDTTSYTGGIANVGLYVTSNVAVGSLTNKNAIVLYSTGLATLQTANDGTDSLRLGSAGQYFGFARNNSTGELGIQGSQAGANDIALGPTSGDVRIPGFLTVGSSATVQGAGGLRTTYGITAATVTTTSGANFATISGNVGIGTASPKARVEITTAIAAGVSNFPLVLTNNNGNSVDDRVGIQFNVHNLSTFYGPFIEGRADGSTGYGDIVIGGTSDGSRIDRMTILNGGNVGISTGNPVYKLDVNGAINGTSILANGVSIGVAAVSSYTFVADGSTSQNSYIVAFATVTVTLNGGYDLEVSYNCGVTLANQVHAGWSVLYDGQNNKFGLTSTTGANYVGGSTAGQASALGSTFPIKRDEITSGSHTFALTILAQSGNSVTWPNAYDSKSSNCRFGVKEIH